MRQSHNVHPVHLAVLFAVLLAGAAGIASAETRFEHIAINVDNPREVADWYVANLGLKIVSANKKMIFVGDQGNHCMFELYHKPTAKGRYSDLGHSDSHVAFATDDADALASKMVAGGAKLLKRFTNPAGDTVINLTDPWGNNLQVIHRVKPKV